MDVVLSAVLNSNDLIGENSLMLAYNIVDYFLIIDQPQKVACIFQHALVEFFEKLYHRLSYLELDENRWCAQSMVNHVTTVWAR